MIDENIAAIDNATKQLKAEFEAMRKIVENTGEMNRALLIERNDALEKLGQTGRDCYSKGAEALKADFDALLKEVKELRKIRDVYSAMMKASTMLDNNGGYGR
jgi:hypothetical protein